MAEGTDGQPWLSSASRQDREVVRFGRGASFSIASSLVAQAALVVTSVVLTRFLSTSDVGVFAQAHAVAALGSLVALVGMRSALTRFVAQYRVDGDAGAVAGVIRIGVATAAITGAALGAVVFFAADWLAVDVFDDAALQTPLRWASLILPGTSVMVAAVSATQGYRNVRPFNIVRRLIEPGVKLALIFVVLSLGGGIDAAMAVSTVTTWIAAFVALFWLRRIRGPIVHPVTYHFGPVYRFAVVSWGAAFAAQGLLWADILMVGWYRSSDEVGLYQVASRVALLAALSIAPMNAVLAPRLANLFRSDRRPEAETMYRVAAAWALRLTLPAAIGMVVVPRTILGVFGPEYIVAVSAMLILVPGQLFDASTATTATVLNMAGENVSTLIGNSAILGINLALNALLIPEWGIDGAAAAWSISLIVVNLYRCIMVRRRVMPVWPWSVATIKATVAGVAALAAGWGVHQFVLGADEAAWTLFPVGAVIALVYGGVLVGAGLTDEDRVLFAGFFKPGRE